MKLTGDDMARCSFNIGAAIISPDGQSLEIVVSKYDEHGFRGDTRLILSAAEIVARAEKPNAWSPLREIAREHGRWDSTAAAEMSDDVRVTNEEPSGG